MNPKHPETTLPTQEELTTSLINQINSYISQKISLETTQQHPSFTNLQTTKSSELSIFSSTLSSTSFLESFQQQNANLLKELEQLKLQTSYTNLVKSNTDEINKVVSEMKQLLFNIVKDINLIKDNINAENDNVLIKHPGQPGAFTGLEQELHVNNIHPDRGVCSLIELQDKRIATSGNDGTISIYSIDYESKQWNEDIRKDKAHEAYVVSLIELSNNRLASGSYHQRVHIWNILEKDLTLLKILRTPGHFVSSILNLSQNRIAACSGDKVITLWKSEEPYEEIKVMKLEAGAHTALQLKDKDILVVSCSSSSLDFWNLNSFEREHRVKGVWALLSNHMIQLQNGNIAVSSYSHGKPIVIVDTENYEIIKEIKIEEYIPNSSGLCLWGNNNFVYSCSGCLLQFSIDNYEVMFASNTAKDLDGGHGLISTKDGKYLVATNNSRGFMVMKPLF